MDREQLEHVIRAAGDALGEKEVILIGSQAILGAYPNDLPRSVMRSREVDVAPVDGDEEKALRINGAIGELTRFDETHGYYAEGVTVDVATLPGGWRDRLIPVNTLATGGVTGLCLDPHDLCVAKLVAGRSKDVDYVAALVQSGHVRREVLLERLKTTDATAERFDVALNAIAGMRRPGRRSRFRRALREIQGQAVSGGSASTSLGVDELLVADASTQALPSPPWEPIAFTTQVSAAPTKYRCQEPTRSGAQCRNELLPGSVCRAHGWQAPTA